jgi:hypothetical protein
MMRICLAMICGAALTACAPTVPDSGTRAENYNTYLQRREAELRGQNAGTAIVPPGVPGSATLDPLDPARPRGDAPNNISPQNGEMIQKSHAAISDEQSFEAVSARETIASDRARLEQLRAQREVIAPTALPTRSGDGGPNIVAYALGSTNRVGEQRYSRSNPFRNGLSATNCAEYAGPDLAQIDFLRRGGPQRDPRSLDPDGDGYACAWDPAPFRAAISR